MERSHVVEMAALHAAVAVVGKTKENADEPHSGNFMTHISAIYQKIKGLKDQEVI